VKKQAAGIREGFVSWTSDIDYISFSAMAIPSIFAHFDTIRIVNLADRRDRRREMLRELRKLGLAGDPRILFFDAIRCSDPGLFRSAGSHGCFLSHLEILKQAASQRQSILILQDDCQFLSSVWSISPSADCDIFYGGYIACNGDNLQSSDIVGAHCMGFSVEAALKAVAFLERLLDPDFPPDPVAASKSDFDPAIRPPIDGACVWLRRAHPELKTEFGMVAYQRLSRSDIAPSRFFDRVWGLRQLAAIGRKIKRRLPDNHRLEHRNAPGGSQQYNPRF